MSKQADAKKVQGYDPKPQPEICSACKNLKSERKLVAWMERDMKAGKKHWSGPAYSLAVDGIEGWFRCGLGGFAVKKTATCQRFERKPEGA